MSIVAFMTYGELLDTWDRPSVKGFVERIDGVFGAAEAAPGHLISANRSVNYNDAESIDELNWGEWGKYRAPKFYQGNLKLTERTNAQTLSLWVDLESVFNFAYSGLHQEALRKRREWFKPPAYPNYVAWWIADEYTPSWDEACTRLEHLHEHGPTPFAFNFKHAFDAEDKPVTIKKGGMAKAN